MTARTPIGANTRLRWHIARLLNRRPDQCWTDLVMWALGNTDRRWWQASSPIGQGCRLDAARNGECFCMKMKSTEGGAS